MNPLNDKHATLIHASEVRFIRLLPGPIECVWEYLVDPDKRSLWFAGGTSERHVGGKSKLIFNNKKLAPGPEIVPEKLKDCAGDNIESDIIVTRYEPPHVYAFQWDGGEVVFELTTQAENVQLVLTHRKLPNHKELLSVSGGWHIHLTVLIAKLEGSPQPPFWSTLERLNEDYEKLFGPAE